MHARVLVFYWWKELSRMEKEAHEMKPFAFFSLIPSIPPLSQCMNCTRTWQPTAHELDLAHGPVAFLALGDEGLFLFLTAISTALQLRGIQPWEAGRSCCNSWVLMPAHLQLKLSF